MRRPSHWILLFTAIAGAGYALTGHAAAPSSPAPAGDAAPAPGPVVIRRTDAPAPADRLAPVTGWLLDAAGWPVRDAVVATTDVSASAHSDGAGAFELWVPAQRRALVTIQTPGFETVQSWMHPGAPLVVTLRPALPWHVDPPPASPSLDGLQGEGFLKRPDGQPAAHAVVTVSETGARVVADESGRYRAPLTDGPVTLIAHDDEGLVARSEPVYSARQRGLVPVPDLTLFPGRSVRGYVRDADGRPCRGAALALRGEGDWRWVRTADDGGFAFTGLLDGDYTVEAAPHHGLLGTERRLTPGDFVDLELQLQESKPLRVAVVHSKRKQPVAGVHVVAAEHPRRRAHALTDDQGQATLDGLGDGPFEFEVRSATTYDQWQVVDYDEQLQQIAVRAP